MQAHRASDARSGGYAPEPQSAGVAHRACEPAPRRFVGAARTVGSGRHGHPVARHFSGRTGAGAPCQVNDEVFLGEVWALGPSRHAGHQSAACVGKVLAGTAVPVGGIAHGFHHRRAGADLALHHQLQRAPAVPGIARQHLHRRDQLAGGVHRHVGLVPFEPAVAAAY